MNAKFSQLIFYVIFLVLVAVLFYFITAPYVNAIFLAIITYILFKPVHTKILNSLKNKKNLAALFSVAIVLVVIITPLLFIGNLLIKESTDFYLKNQNISAGSAQIETVVTNIENYVHSRIPGSNFKLNHFLNISQYTEQVFKWLTSHLSSFFSGILRVTLGVFLYVLCLFYLFRDHERLIKNILAWSPLFDAYDNLILNKISLTVNSVLRGQLLIGLIQGILTVVLL
jgi:predicted PurR-regulated permease PerM